MECHEMRYLSVFHHEIDSGLYPFSLSQFSLVTAAAFTESRQWVGSVHIKQGFTLAFGNNQW